MMRRTCLSCCLIPVLMACAAEPPAEPRPGALSGPEPARPAPIVWPAGPMQVRVALSRQVGETEARAVVGKTIPFEAADRVPTAGRGALHIAAASLEDEGRTLVLTTDPHPYEARYTLPLSGLNLPGLATDAAYDLSGVEVSWREPDADEPSWVGWWPHFDPTISRTLTAGSVAHGRGFERSRRPGELSLRAWVTLPEGQHTIRVRSDSPIVEAALGGEPAEPEAEGREARLVGAGGDQPLELLLTLRTGDTPKPPALAVTDSTADDPAERPLAREQIAVPWSPGPPPPAAEPPPVPPALTGGDPARGEAVFFSDEARCSACHKFRGRGGDVGPDLGQPPRRDAASILRDINDPSAVINPDYLPFTVALKDGRVAVGVVRAEGADSIRVLNTNAKSETFPRAEIADLQPSRTSIMPVGLTGALGEARLRDLIAYLASDPRPDDPPPAAR